MKRFATGSPVLQISDNGEIISAIFLPDGQHFLTVRPYPSGQLQIWNADAIPRRSPVVAESRLTSDDDVLRLLGSTYLHYDVHSIVATARTGTIFRALDTITGQTVALKVFWPLTEPERVCLLIVLSLTALRVCRSHE